MKSPRFAAVLSLFSPGLGQLYANRPVRAVVFLLVPLLLTLVMIGLVAMEPSALVLALMAMLVLAAPILFLSIVIDAGRVARHAPRDEVSRWWQHPLAYGLVFVVGLAYPLISAAFLRAEVVEAYKIPTMSMAPTIVVGDRILVRKWAWGSEDARRGDLVVFLPPGEGDRAYVKRVAGLPGEKVVRRDGTAKTVQAGHLWLLGDNVKNSRDSRHFGAIPFENLIGRVAYRYWPPSRVGPLPPLPDGYPVESGAIGVR